MDRRAEGFPDPTGGPHLNHPDGLGNAETPGFSEKQIIQIRKLTQIGRALSAERSIERLLEMRALHNPAPPGSFIDDLPRDVPDEETAPNYSGE